MLQFLQPEALHQTSGAAQSLATSYSTHSVTDEGVYTAPVLRIPAISGPGRIVTTAPKPFNMAAACSRPIWCVMTCLYQLYRTRWRTFTWRHCTCHPTAGFPKTVADSALEAKKAGTIDSYAKEMCQLIAGETGSVTASGDSSKHLPHLVTRLPPCTFQLAVYSCPECGT